MYKAINEKKGDETVRFITVKRREKTHIREKKLNYKCVEVLSNKLAVRQQAGKNLIVSVHSASDSCLRPR